MSTGAAAAERDPGGDDDYTHQECRAVGAWRIFSCIDDNERGVGSEGCVGLGCVDVGSQSGLVLQVRR
ncbi:hypothetical protein AC1659_14480 [Rhodococcus erythropolis]|uniref:hypothetical protein n=1 Tax=Rhodococcus erythropolis TaxID=1833 RepID=UPI001BACEC44|nr:hypothetical protein [Rhodococcus erythropolis]MBS2990479.1 hypothetical protein [Rhodococcus erythropolis]